MYIERSKRDVEWWCGGLGCAQEGGMCECFQMHHEPDTTHVGRNFVEYLHPFAGDRGLENWKPGEVSVGPRYIRDKTAADGIADKHEYNGYGARFPLHDLGHEIGAGHDHVRRHTDQLFGESPRFVGIGASPARFDPDIAVFGPAQSLKPLPKCRNARLSICVAFAETTKHPPPPHPLGLLRADDERPCRGRAAQKRDELAPSHCRP